MENNLEKEGFEHLKHINEKLGINKEEEQELTERLLNLEKEDLELEKDAAATERKIEKDLHEGDHDHHEDKELLLKFIVNTTGADVKVKENEILAKAVEQAFKDTGNEGRPLSDWTVKYEGRELDTAKTVKELGLPDCAEILVSLKAGGGGQY